MARTKRRDRDDPRRQGGRRRPGDRAAVHAGGDAPVRRDRVGDPGRRDRRPGQARVRAARRRVPQELDPERDQHRRAEVLPRADGLPRSASTRSSRWSAAWPARSRRGAARAATSPRQADGDAFEAELSHILVNQLAAFNSPVWFNVGFEEQPQCSACFILSVEDSMESILDWNTKEGMIFRGGSGSGINLSKIRSSKEQLSKGGLASGPVSFMRGADAWAGTIKSGGKTRRAAKMVVLDVDHPDIQRLHLVQGARGGQGRGARRGRLRHVDRRRGLPLDPVPEREQLGARDGRVPRRRRARRRVEDDRARRAARPSTC